MSLKRNILVSYLTQIYVTLIGILILPLYLRYMGAEAYGLVGFFTMLQAWFNLLDIGLTPTVARETARLHGGATDALTYRRLLRALQLIFFSIALVGGAIFFACSGLIAHYWLNAQSLSLGQVENALKLMALGVAVRWISGLYRGCISGAERLVWLGAFNATLATARFIFVLPILIWISPSPEVFFSYQLLVAATELSCLIVKARRTFPVLQKSQIIGWSVESLIKPIRSILKFSLAIAFTSSVWILATQADKLVMSKLLTLSDYGYFTLAVLAASGVMMISGPISSALMPRMARLQAEGDEVRLILLYRKATQMVAIIALPACLLLALFAEHVLWIWTGDRVAATQAASVLRLYALGNGLLVLSAFPYYLQFAKGDLKLHLWGNILFLFLLIPSLFWASWHHGSLGAGYAWLLSNLVYFLIWVPLVHRRFARGLHYQWLVHDLGQIFVSSSLAAGLLLFLIKWSPDRMVALGWMGFAGVIIFMAGIFSSSVAREMFIAFKKNRNSLKR